MTFFDPQIKPLGREDLTSKEISNLQFGLLSPSKLQWDTEFQVFLIEIFSRPMQTTATGRCLDLQLGVSDKVSTCTTCKLKLLIVLVTLDTFNWHFLFFPLHRLHKECVKHTAIDLQKLIPYCDNRKRLRKRSRTCKACYIQTHKYSVNHSGIHRVNAQTRLERIE